MREIIELNRQILAELPETIEEESFPVIDREDGPELWPEASVAVRQAAEAVHSELNRIIPEDFIYTVYLGDDSPDMMLFFNDGAQTASFRGVEPTEQMSIAQQFASVDWDEELSLEIKKCQTFEEMKAEATHRPVNLPSTKQLQNAFREPMKQWVKEKRRESSVTHVFLWNDRDGFADEVYPNIDALRDELADIMVVREYVVAIVTNGKPLSVKRIDHLKAETLKMMKEHMPISYARATGRLGLENAPEDSGEDEDEH